MVFMIGFPCLAVAQDTTAVVVGQIGGSDGAPVGSIIIDVLGVDGIATLSDSTGRFRLDVPRGEVVLRAVGIGYDTGLWLLDLRERDSVDVRLRIEKTEFPVNGTDWETPEQRWLGAANRVMRELLQLGVVREFAREALGTHSDTIIVWIPWGSGVDTVMGRDPAFHVVSQCGPCSESTGWTPEGGPWYTAGEAHLRVGVTAYRTESPMFRFCVGAAGPGDWLFPNCGGPRRWINVTYVLLGGRWRMVEDLSAGLGGRGR